MKQVDRREVKYKQTYGEIVCMICSSKKEATGKDQIYCSRKCYYIAKTGNIRVRTGVYKNCIYCSQQFYAFPRQKESREFCSKVCSNKSRTGKPYHGINAKYWKGKKLPEETKRKISETRIRLGISAKQPTGENAYNWRGGTTKPNKLFRKRKVYALWRESVFKRDNFTCTECGAHNYPGLGYSVKLNADHIKPFAFFPELRLELSNGRTLCEGCHRKTDTWGKRAFKYERV